MYVCKRCGEAFQEDWRKDPTLRRKGDPQFCSRRCACGNSHHKYQEGKPCEHCGEPIPAGYGKQGNKYCNSQCSADARKKALLDEWLITGQLGANHPAYVREYLMEKQGGCCAECGVPGVWRGKPLSMDIDHIDGDPLNNAPLNLRILCPNCHRITAYWGNSAAKRSGPKGRYRINQSA